MKKVVVFCQTAPGAKRRLAEEAFRLAAGLAATGRIQVDLILKDGGLLWLEPEFCGSSVGWESLNTPVSRVLVPAHTILPSQSPTVVKLVDLETPAQTADLVLRF